VADDLARAGYSEFFGEIEWALAPKPGMVYIYVP
jgi:hypothetical protein